MTRIIIITSILAMIVSCSSANNISFNSNIWKSNKSQDRVKDEELTLRQKMLESVIKIIEGKSKSEITELLGDGVKTEYFKSTGRDLIYVLGPERSFFSIDYEWLLLWFDKKGKLKKHMITTD